MSRWSPPPNDRLAPVDDLDALFYQHDLVYQLNENNRTITTEEDVHTADVKLVEGMYALAQSNFNNNPDPEALLYEGLTTLGIVDKIQTDSTTDRNYFSNLPPAEQAFIFINDGIANALTVGIANLEAGFAGLRAEEARSLNGAFNIFERDTANIALLVQHMAGTFVTSADGLVGTPIHEPPSATLAPTLTHPQ